MNDIKKLKGDERRERLCLCALFFFFGGSREKYHSENNFWNENRHLQNTQHCNDIFHQNSTMF